MQFIKDIFSEKSGKGSAMRVKSFLILFVVMFLSVYKYDVVPQWLFIALLIAAFAPQLVQKFGEISMEKFGVKFVTSKKVEDGGTF